MKPSFSKRILIGGVALALGVGAVASLASLGVAHGAGRVVAAQATPAAGQGKHGKGGGPQGGGQRGGAMHGAVGSVTAISGNTITLAGKNSVSVTVTVSSTTTFSKQATVALADVPVGKQIQAVGTLDGSTFTATRIHVMDKAAQDTPRQGQPKRGAGQGQRGGAAKPTTTATATPKAKDAGHLMGTVTAASADSLTVTKADGSTVTVKLASGGSVHQQVSASLADVTVGTTIRAAGQRSGTSVAAQHIAILPAAK
ncbi:hypothetical protein F8S13_01150 [Chloroflexia bacterium SDU3-3]|nr:hypothetical protein F8S13_01150 [Chloroflexia bacterium SDU3-3]